MNENKIGEKLRYLRKAKGLTTQEVADIINVSQSYISRFENGRAIPDIDMLDHLLKALDSNLSTFFSSDIDELPEDIISLVQTVKKLTPDARKKLNEFLKLLIEQ